MVHSLWRGCLRPVLLVEVARNDALVEKLWSLQTLGSGGWSRQAGHWGAAGKVGADCVQMYLLCLRSSSCNGMDGDEGLKAALFSVPLLTVVCVLLV